MSGNFKKEDLRIVKTQKALITSLSFLLSQRNFGKITVNDLCEEALVSRATFYAHFNDKYDLLNFWLGILVEDFKNNINLLKLQDIEIEYILNKIITENIKIILNLLEDANTEILKLLNGFLYSIIETSVEEKQTNQISSDHFTLLNFCAGGMVNMLLQQCKKPNFAELPLVINYFCKLLKHIIEWDSNQN